MQTFLGSDTLNWNYTFKAGTSRIEKGITPYRDLTIYIDTFSQIGYECGQSRLWAGVHFQVSKSTITTPPDPDRLLFTFLQDAIDAIKPIASYVGHNAAEYVMSHAAGKPRPPTKYNPKEVNRVNSRAREMTSPYNENGGKYTQKTGYRPTKVR